MEWLYYYQKYFNPKITRNRHYTIQKGLLYQADITIIGTYVHKSRRALNAGSKT